MNVFLLPSVWPLFEGRLNMYFFLKKDNDYIIQLFAKLSLRLIHKSNMFFLLKDDMVAA